MPEIQERITLGARETSRYRSELHEARYRFAADWVGENMTVLDVACGTGYGVAFIESAGAGKVVGVDYSNATVSYATTHFSTNQTKFLSADATRGPFRNHIFDVVICMETIEHVADADAFLKEVGRILRPEGLFIVSTPNKLFHSPHSDKPHNPFHVV